MADAIHTGSVFTENAKSSSKIYYYLKIMSSHLLFLLLSQKNAKVVTIDDYEDVPVNSETALQKAVANQPVSVAIEAGGRDFQFYASVTTFLPLPHHG